MATYIGQASCDERGTYVGGQAGNQSGTELNIRAAYLRNWHTLIRFNDADRARKCGQAMADAVANRMIGYDQGERNTILERARTVGFALGKIAVACECDCSSLAGVCGIAAGAPESAIYQYGNLCYTGNIAERFSSTGLVTVYHSSEYVGSTAKWQIGDIIVSDTHTIVVTGGLEPSGGGNGGSGSGSVTSDDIEALAQAVIDGRIPVEPERSQILGDKAAAVQARVNELLLGTPNAPGTSTGEARIIAGTYKVIASSLNVRSAPSLSASVVAAYGYGGVIYDVSADITQADGYTWASYIGASGNRRYVAMGTVDGSDKYLVKV